MNEKTDRSGESNHFHLIVTALMIVILVALAGLWIVERGRRLRAETDLVELQSTSQQKMQSMGNMLVQQMTQSPSIAVNRNQLATQQVTWNGDARTVLLLSAAEGEKLGFAPGDAILVTPPADTASAEQKNEDNKK